MALGVFVVAGVWFGFDRREGALNGHPAREEDVVDGEAHFHRCFHTRYRLQLCRRDSLTPAPCRRRLRSVEDLFDRGVCVFFSEACEFGFAVSGDGHHDPGLRQESDEKLLGIAHFIIFLRFFYIENLYGEEENANFNE